MGVAIMTEEDNKKRCGVAFKVKVDARTGEMPLDMFKKHLAAATRAMQRHLAHKYNIHADEEDIKIRVDDNRVKLIWCDNPETYRDVKADIIAFDINKGETTMEQKPIKRWGCIRLSFEALAEVIGMKAGSIRVIETTHDPAFIKIIHEDDQLPLFDLGEGQSCPQNSQSLVMDLRIKKLKKLGWTVIPPGDSESDTNK